MDGPAGAGFRPRCRERRTTALSAFTPDAAAALGGPDWLTARRIAAAEAFAAASLPSAEEEVWRYSRIDDLDLDGWTLGQPGEASIESDADLAAAGVYAGPLADAPQPEEVL